MDAWGALWTQKQWLGTTMFRHSGTNELSYTVGAQILNMFGFGMVQSCWLVNGSVFDNMSVFPHKYIVNIHKRI